jgi:hypothetical protein
MQGFFFCVYCIPVIWSRLVSREGRQFESFTPDKRLSNAGLFLLCVLYPGYLVPALRRGGRQLILFFWFLNLRSAIKE